MNPLFNQSLEKGLAILCAFTVDRRLMTIGEIATACDMNRSSAQRMVYTLEQLGFIQRHPRSRRYQLTVKALQPGSDYLAANALIDVANPFLAELTNATRETTCLTEPYEGEMVYIARFISPRFIPVHMPIGSRIPMYCTSAGRAYLSALPTEESQQVLSQQPRKTHTIYTKTALEDLMVCLQDARSQGYAVNQEELFLGDMTLGAPILGAKNKPVAAIHIVAPTSRWTLDKARKHLAPALIACARALSNAVRTRN